MDQDAFRAYFMSHAAFVVRSVDGAHVMGVFYIKPNFPGRCSHICNGGFITDPEFRGRGVGALMGRCFLWLAKGVGYKASYFNLVRTARVSDGAPAYMSRYCMLQPFADVGNTDECPAEYAAILGRTSRHMACSLTAAPRARICRPCLQVFDNNTASKALWDSLGYTRLAVVPKAGRLIGCPDLIDAVQYHYDLETLKQEDNFLHTLKQC